LPAVDPTVVDIPYAYFIYNVREAGLLSVHPRYVTLPARSGVARSESGAGFIIDNREG
jgi:hypothetical protein